MSRCLLAFLLILCSKNILAQSDNKSDNIVRQQIDSLISIQYNLKSDIDKNRLSDTVYVNKAIKLILSIQNHNLDDKYNFLAQNHKFSSIVNEQNYERIIRFEKALSIIEDNEYLLHDKLCIYYYELKRSLVDCYYQENDFSNFIRIANETIDQYSEEYKLDLFSDAMLNGIATSIASIINLQNKESYIVNSEIINVDGLDLRSQASHYYNMAGAKQDLGLHEEASSNYKNYLNNILKLVNLTRFDSTNISTAYNSLGHFTNEPQYFIQANNYIRSGDHWCKQSCGNLEQVLIKLSLRNTRNELIDFYSKLTEDDRYKLCAEFESVTLTYYLIVEDWNAIINTTRPYIEDLSNDNRVGSHNFDFIHKYLIANNRSRNINEVGKVLLDYEISLDDTQKEYYMYNASLELMKTEYYLNINLDSAIYYLKELISTENANPFPYNKGDDNIQKYIRTIETIIYKKLHDPNYKFYSNGDTLNVNDIAWNSTNLSPEFSLGEHDCLVIFNRLYDKVNLTIKSKRGILTDTYYDLGSNNKVQVNLTSEFQKTVENFIDDYRNVYIVADGEFSLLSYSSLIHSTHNLPWSKIYNLYRLSSIDDLKTLFNSHPEQKEKHLVDIHIVGAPTFSKDSEVLNTNFGSALRGLKNDDYNWPYLNGAKDEASYISNIMSKYNYNVVLQTDENASEANIRKVSSPDILHITTHGFIDTTGISNKYGIVLANANEKNKNQDNDGYLYSEDISKLNLTDTKLVVVSACESGLYKQESDLTITKALFSAGAKHQLVSLWKIDDNATKDLMNSFYNNLVQSRNIKEAYQLAQNFMREKYKDEYYWGSFILLSQSLNYKI